MREHNSREEPGRARHDHSSHHTPSHGPEGWPRTGLRLSSFPLHEVIYAVQTAVSWASGQRRHVGEARALRQGGRRVRERRGGGGIGKGMGSRCQPRCCVWTTAGGLGNRPSPRRNAVPLGFKDAPNPMLLNYCHAVGRSTKTRHRRARLDYTGPD